GPAAVLRAGSGVGGSHNRAPPRTGAVPMVHPGPSRKLRRELRGAFREERRTRAGPVPALFFRPSRMPTRMSDIEIPDRLVDDIIAGDCVAFVGAGFKIGRASCRGRGCNAGCGGWREKDEAW